MSFLPPHFLEEGRGKLEVYFTRVYNPAWTNLDGTRRPFWLFRPYRPAAEAYRAP